MLTTLHILLATEPGIALAGALVMFGWLCGVAFMAVWFWRRLTRPLDEERRLRLALEDADRQLVHLYAANGRLALLLGEQARVDGTSRRGLA